MSKNLNSEARLYLYDLIGEISRIKRFIGDMSCEEFLQDDKTMLAVQKSLENIGEACIKICQEDSFAKEKFPEIGLGDWASFKNKMNHWYHEVNFEEVYNSAVNDTAELEENILKHMDSDIKLIADPKSPRTSLELYKKLEVGLVRKSNFHDTVERLKSFGDIKSSKESDKGHEPG